MQFGDILRQLIEDNNLTQKKVGTDMNIAPTTIGNYVRNIREPDYTTLKMIAAYFNVSTDFLLDNHPADNPVHNHEEDVLLGVYRSLDDAYRDILLSQAKALCKLKQQK